ncbi:MAG: hypothetical protein AVDCRST_MAG90-154 [uncultured Microvirga sp.]|uniref:Uncharacterized protein n=1 Tax=uncultured Microvirga sp. TaxID=412392 RepID=A0A6J4KJ87_9HYPH|nr:MAG: hypothetical protein AVDCRST_MAG90-154 [uncultured Microvirga sp.]
MATYQYRCPLGHVTELVQPMSDPTPAEVPCGGEISAVEIVRADVPPAVGDLVPGRDAYACVATAARIFTVPAAIVFRGSGFYSTDVRGRLERRRRKNAGDSLPREHDAAADAIARRI